jgi:hypothetical protein
MSKYLASNNLFEEVFDEKKAGFKAAQFRTESFHKKSDRIGLKSSSVSF